MTCNRITVENFRNIRQADVCFSPGVNVLYGDNAQGKTNLLEAIFFTAIGKSFRPVKEAEMIRFGEESASVVNRFSDSVREQTLAFRIFSNAHARRTVTQNGVRLQRMSEMVGAFRVVLFCPEHLSLIQGGPELRRAFLNVALSQLRPVYLKSLQRYNQILRERNSLLKRAPDDMDTFRATEPVWSAQLAHEAAILAAHRDRYIAQIDRHVRQSFAEMTDEGEVPVLSYANSLKVSGDALADTQRTEAAYLELLSSHHDREIAAGATLYGIHKDDIVITLNSRPARLYASQGQQRSLALAMKLGEGAVSAAESGGDMPVFLFDDVLSELDAHRRAYLMREMKGRQVILTTCDPSSAEGVPEAITRIHVAEGEYEVRGNSEK